MSKLSNSEGIRLLEDTKVVAILRGIPETCLLQVAKALFVGGVRVMEVTLNTSGAKGMIHSLQQEFGDRMWIGAGTVIDVEGAIEAYHAGASFFVTPNVNEAVIEFAGGHGLEVLAGAFTPTEIIRAYTAGARMVKVFPSGSLGPGYIKELRGPLPHIPMVAVGGIHLHNAADFIRAGAIAIGIGSHLVDRKAVTEGNYSIIQETANQLIRIVRGDLQDD